MAHAELDWASDKLVRLIAEASRRLGGRSDYALWMERWAWARPQFVTALDPGLTGQSV